MTTAFNRHFRKDMHLLSGCQLPVLTCLLLHANGNLRTWVGVKTIASEIGWSQPVISTAIEKLQDIAMVVLVPGKKRRDEEKKLTPRKHVFQLTGFYLKDGILHSYLWWDKEDSVTNISRVVDCLEAKDRTIQEAKGKDSFSLKEKFLILQDSFAKGTKEESLEDSQEEDSPPNGVAGKSSKATTATEKSLPKPKSERDLLWDALEEKHPEGWVHPAKSLKGKVVKGLLEEKVAAADVPLLFRHVSSRLKEKKDVRPPEYWQLLNYAADFVAHRQHYIPIEPPPIFDIDISDVEVPDNLDIDALFKQMAADKEAQYASRPTDGE